MDETTNNVPISNEIRALKAYLEELKKEAIELGLYDWLFADNEEEDEESEIE